MPVRFAVATGNWSNTAIWDNGALPVAGDTVHPNGFTVTLDQDINVASLNNNATTVSIPNIATPAMTSNTQPTGTVISSNNAGNAYVCFNQDGSNTNYWTSGVASTGWIGYTFQTPKVIKRYIIKISSTSQGNPKTWTFEGSNDGFATAGVQLDQVLSYTTNGNYASVLLANTTAYTSYRLNVTAVQGLATVLICELEMTESTTASPVYGGGAGGSFTVPASLSGTRNIVQTGAGILAVNTVVTTAHTSGNTVNFNVQSGGYILNPNSHTANLNNSIIQINGNGAVNFNGNIWGSQTINITNTFGLIYINNNATVTINGNVYAAKGGTSTYKLITTAVTTSNSSILNINGDIIGSNYYAASYPIAAESLATTNIVGNLTSDLGNCYYSTIGSVINLTGTATVTNANSQAAINMTSAASLLTINGSITNKNNVNAIFVPKIRFASTATPVWIYQTNVGTDIALSYGTPVTGPYPAEADVRYNTAYGASPTRYGTLRVPLPQYVSQGVLTDNTTGTAYLSATDVWNVLTSNITTAGSIGERLKNASTVQTNGDQLAAYIV